MPSKFIATVNRKNVSCTIKSIASIYQQIGNTLHGPIAYIYDETLPMYYRNTQIYFSDGLFDFSEDYDAPLQSYKCDLFPKKTCTKPDVTLHRFLSSKSACLCSSIGILPIITVREEGMFELQIYQPSSPASDNGLHSKLLATVIQTKNFESSFEYVIQIEEDLPPSLLAVISSLPFILLDIHRLWHSMES